MSLFADFNSVYAEYFTGKPARSCVAVKEIPKDVIKEIQALDNVYEANGLEL